MLMKAGILGHLLPLFSACPGRLPHQRPGTTGSPMHGARDAIYICEYDKGFMEWMGECARYLGSLVV